MGRRNAKWPEVRRSPTPAAPLHPPAAAKDPQPPFCVFGARIQRLVQCMWAILKVVSRSPSSSVEFHHVPQSPRQPRGKRIRAARTPNHTQQQQQQQRPSSRALLPSLIQPGGAGLFGGLRGGKRSDEPPWNSQSPRMNGGRSPRGSPARRGIPPASDVKLGSALTGGVRSGELAALRSKRLRG